MVTLLTLLACSDNDENVSSSGLDGKTWDVEHPDGSADTLELTSYPLQDLDGENYSPAFRTWVSDSMDGVYSLNPVIVCDRYDQYWVSGSEEEGGYYENRCAASHETDDLALTLYTYNSYLYGDCESGWGAEEEDCPSDPIGSYVLVSNDEDWKANVDADSPYVSDNSDIPLRDGSVLLAE